MGRELILKRQLIDSAIFDSTRRCLIREHYPVLDPRSGSYPRLQGRLPTCYAPVRHFTRPRRGFLVRLACMKHAASVRSEPGSNSPLEIQFPQEKVLQKLVSQRSKRPSSGAVLHGAHTTIFKDRFDLVSRVCNLLWLVLSVKLFSYFFFDHSLQLCGNFFPTGPLVAILHHGVISNIRCLLLSVKILSTKKAPLDHSSPPHLTSPPHSRRDQLSRPANRNFFLTARANLHQPVLLVNPFFQPGRPLIWPDKPRPVNLLYLRPARGPFFFQYPVEADSIKPSSR